MSKNNDDEEITHSRTCDECERETYKFERCHHCGNRHWEVITDGGRDIQQDRVHQSTCHAEGCDKTPTHAGPAESANPEAVRLSCDDHARTEDESL